MELGQITTVVPAYPYALLIHKLLETIQLGPVSPVALLLQILMQIIQLTFVYQSAPLVPTFTLITSLENASITVPMELLLIRLLVDASQLVQILTMVRTVARDVFKVVHGGSLPIFYCISVWPNAVLIPFTMEIQIL